MTVADLVFPWFMFIMGVNITLSVESLLKRNTSRLEITYKVVRRTLILFALGLTAININSKLFTLVFYVLCSTKHSLLATTAFRCMAALRLYGLL